MIITFDISEDENTQLIEMVSDGTSRSEVIRQALFKRRERTIRELPPLTDLTFLSEVNNMLSGMIDAHRRKEDIVLDLLELQEKVNAKLKY